jgi:hypothetical protein
MRVTVDRMARPLTKSPPIQFRLPLDAYIELQRRADDHDETVREYLVRNLTRLLATADA